MTVPANVSRWQYQGNGSGTSFAYTAKVFAKTDLVVTKTDAAGADTLLVVDVDYTVSGVGDADGGDVLYPVSGSPLAVGESLTIQRVVPITQLLDLRNQGAWLPENHEDAYDRLTMIAQQHDDALLRSLRFPASDDAALSAILPGAATRALKLLGFDSDGKPIATAGGITGALVSVFMETVLDDPDAATALATLGVSAFVQTLLNDADAATARATLEALKNVLTTRGDLVRAGVAGVAERLALAGTAESVLMSNTVDALWGNPLPQGYLTGLGISRVAAFDVQVEAGAAKSAANVWTIRLAAALVKQLDATWVAGTNQGGRPAAVSLTADTWYHVFVIFNASTGAVDAGFDTSPTAANLLAASGYTHYRRVGSVLTNAGPTDIEDFLQAGPWFFWKTPLGGGSLFNAGTTAALRAVHAPPDVKPLVWLNVMLGNPGSDTLLYLSSPDADDVGPAETNTVLATLRSDSSVNGVFMGLHGPIRLDASRQLRHRASLDATPVRLSVTSWYDPL